MDKWATMEAEMNAIIERLNQPGGLGLSSNLVDSKTDIDIPVVRAKRCRLAELHNDHKEISEKINQNIQILLAARLGGKTSPLVSGKVVAVGPGTRDTLLLPEYGGTQVKLEDKEEEDILGTLHD